VLGDTICEYDVQEVISSAYSMLGVRKVGRSKEILVWAEIDDNGFIDHVIEKAPDT